MNRTFTTVGMIALALVATTMMASAANMVTNASFTDRDMTGWTLINEGTGRTSSQVGAANSVNGITEATPDGIKDSVPYADASRTYSTYYAEIDAGNNDAFCGGSYNLGALGAGTYTITFDFVRVKSPAFPLDYDLNLVAFLADGSTSDTGNMLGDKMLTLDLQDSEVCNLDPNQAWSTVTASEWSVATINITLDGTEGANTLVIGMTNSESATGLTRMMWDDVQVEVPEPATMSLLLIGGVALLRRRRK